MRGVLHVYQDGADGFDRLSVGGNLGQRRGCCRRAGDQRRCRVEVRTCRQAKAQAAGDFRRGDGKCRNQFGFADAAIVIAGKATATAVGFRNGQVIGQCRQRRGINGGVRRIAITQKRAEDRDGRCGIAGQVNRVVMGRDFNNQRTAMGRGNIDAGNGCLSVRAAGREHVAFCLCRATVDTEYLDHGIGHGSFDRRP